MHLSAGFRQVTQCLMLQTDSSWLCHLSASASDLTPCPPRCSPVQVSIHLKEGFKCFAWLPLHQANDVAAPPPSLVTKFLGLHPDGSVSSRPRQSLIIPLTRLSWLEQYVSKTYCYSTGHPTKCSRFFTYTGVSTLLPHRVPNAVLQSMGGYPTQFCLPSTLFLDKLPNICKFNQKITNYNTKQRLLALYQPMLAHWNQPPQSERFKLSH